MTGDTVGKVSRRFLIFWGVDMFEVEGNIDMVKLETRNHHGSSLILTTLLCYFYDRRLDPVLWLLDLQRVSDCHR